MNRYNIQRLLKSVFSAKCRQYSIFILAGAVVMLCCSCGKKSESLYDFGRINAEELIAADESAKMPGFAAGLCIPDDGDTDSSGVDAAGYALFNVTDAETVSQHAVFDKKYPASTTKILTCLIALEETGPDDIVTVPAESDIDIAGSSMAGLLPGDKIAMKDLLYGLMVPSGNDAAVAIASHISGSSGDFAELMNRKAYELGATHSHFVNPNGLPDEEHYTTVYDMYLIFNEALKHEEFRTITSADEYSCTVTDAAGNARQLTWKSTNAFLNGRYQLPENISITAGKTGHTGAAGYCLVQGEQCSEKEYISIVMGAADQGSLYRGTAELISESAR